MAEVTISKEVSNRIGRAFAMLYTRTAMYNIDHPFAEQSLAGFYKEITHDLNFCSPLVLIMHQDQFFVEEEQLDPRINTSKLLQHFKKGAVHSISFEKGLGDTELKTFIGIFNDLANNPDADAMKKACGEQSVSNIKINHVFYKKITEEDEVINRRVLKEATAAATKKTQAQETGKVFEMMAESVLQEELEKSLSLSNIIQNPAEASQKMIGADRAAAADPSEAAGSGSLIMHNLNKIQQEVGKASAGMSGKNLQQLAVAVFDMKKDLLNGIEAQKADGVIFENVEAIEDEANELTDKVLIQLIKDEYKQGKISVPRLSQIIRRLIPDPKELKRLIPKIKDALVEEGMPLDTFLQLSGELKTELKSEELSKVLEKSAEEMGISGETLIREVSLNPKGAAELIYLASEIRKGTGDETVMTDLLVDYVERVGSKIALDAADQQGDDGGKQLRGIITSIESTLLSQLKNKNIDAATVHKVAERLNDRMEACIEKLESRFENMQQAAASGDGGKSPASVLEIFEEDADEEAELKDLLQKVRSSVEDDGLDENDFGQIHQAASGVMAPSSKKPPSAVTPASKLMESAAPLTVMLPKGILKRSSLLYMLEKEIARSRRYDTSFSILILSIYDIVPDIQVDTDNIPVSGVMGLILETITPHIRESDIFGMLDDNKVLAIMPVTKKEKGRKAMGRLLKIIHEERYIFNDIPLTVRLAGAVIPFDSDSTPSLTDYLNRAESEINDMAMRLKNVQSIY